MEDQYKAELERNASLGCTKCIDELETGKKTFRTHSNCCPRSPKYINKGDALPTTPTPAVALAIESNQDGSVASAVAVAHKQKRGSVSDNEDEDVDIGVGTKSNNIYVQDDTKQSSSNVDEEDPSSIPRRVGNTVDFPVSNLKHLICSLCNGYFRYPYTVSDCLHTFCRSCLILFFRQGMRCCPTW